MLGEGVSASHPVVTKSLFCGPVQPSLSLSMFLSGAEECACQDGCDSERRLHLPCMLWKQQLWVSYVVVLAFLAHQLGARITAVSQAREANRWTHQESSMYQRLRKVIVCQCSIYAVCVPQGLRPHKASFQCEGRGA